MTIVNGNFNAWEEGKDLATGWEIVSPRGTACAEKCGKGRKDANTHAGDFCQGWTGDAGDGISTRMRVKPDTYYVITYWTRFAGPGTGMRGNWDYLSDAIVHEVIGADGKAHCIVPGSSTAWTKLHLYFTTGKNETEVVFRSRQQKKGKYYLAAVSLSEGEREKVKVGSSVHVKAYYPAERPRFTEWVNLIKVPNGDLVATFRELVGGDVHLPSIYSQWFGPEGAADRKKYQAEMHRRMIVSRDQGKTWKPVEYPDEGLGEARRTSPSDEREGYWSYSNWGASGGSRKVLVLGEAGIYSSGDCVTWDKVMDVDMRQAEYWNQYEGEVIELRDGTVMIIYVGRKKDAKPYRKDDVFGEEYLISAAAWVTEDRGRSWREILVAPGYYDEKERKTHSFEEVTAAETADGDVLFILRTSTPAEDTFHQVKLSKKSGTWAAGKIAETTLDPVLFSGHPCLIRLKSGVLVCAGAAHQYIFSDDNGATWQNRNLSCGLIRGHYPRMVELEDNRVLAMYHIGADWPYPPFDDQWINCTILDVEKR